MKITRFVYIVDGAFGIKHHFYVISTEDGLEKALKYIEGKDVVSRKEEDVDYLKRYMGCSANRFETYFMDGAKKVEKVNHYSTGSEFSVVYS